MVKLLREKLIKIKAHGCTLGLKDPACDMRMLKGMAWATSHTGMAKRPNPFCKGGHEHPSHSRIHEWCETC